MQARVTPGDTLDIRYINGEGRTSRRTIEVRSVSNSHGVF